MLPGVVLVASLILPGTAQDLRLLALYSKIKLFSHAKTNSPKRETILLFFTLVLSRGSKKGPEIIPDLQ